MAARLEKVVAAPDPLDLQHIGPDRCQLLLQLALRSTVSSLQLTGIRRRQRLAVQLAVGGQRHAVEDDEMGGHHVIRQVRPEFAFQHFTKTLLILISLSRHQVRSQLPVQRQHTHFAHSRARLQPRFDFTQFYAEAANFHLVVDAPGVVNHACRPITRQVTGAVQAAAIAGKRIGHKAFGSQRGAVVITPRQTGVTDVQLATATLSDRVEIGVQHVPGQVGNRLANRAGGILRVSQRDRSIGHVHSGFSDAVHVDQLRRLITEALEPRFQASDVQRFAAEDDCLQRHRHR